MPKEVTQVDDDAESSEIDSGDDGTKVFVADRDESERVQTFSLSESDESDESDQ